MLEIGNSSEDLRRLSENSSSSLAVVSFFTSTVVEFQSDDDQNEGNVEIEVQLEREYGHR